MRDWYQLMLCIAFSLSFSGLYLLAKAFLSRVSAKHQEPQEEQEAAAERRKDGRVAVAVFLVMLPVAVILAYMIEKTISKGGV